MRSSQDSCTPLKRGFVMSVSGISSANYAYQSQFQQIMNDFSALKTDLSSSDLATSQQAYTTLTKDLQNMRQAQGIQVQNSQVSTDLAAVGSALQSGDLSGAQSAFATLTQDLQSSAQQAQSGQQAYMARGHHHHHHHGGSQQSTGSNLGTDLAAVGSALQSGDLSGAQSAFGTLMQDLTSGLSQNSNGTSGSGIFVQVTSLSISITV